MGGGVGIDGSFFIFFVCLGVFLEQGVGGGEGVVRETWEAVAMETQTQRRRDGEGVDWV